MPTTPSKSRISLKSALFGAIVLLAVASGIYWQWGGDADAPKALTQTITKGNIEDTVSAVGTLQPVQAVDVGAQVSGQLQKVLVTYGDKVTQGQLLAEIDPTLQQSRVAADEAQLQSLQAQLESRRADLALARQRFDRQKGLLAENATSREEFDAAENTLKVATAQIAALEAQIKQAISTLEGNRANLEYTKIVAPIDGVVVDLVAKQGQTLNANQTAPLVLKIADLSQMTVWAQVSEADVQRLKVGMKAYFTTLGVNDKRRFGTLRQIIPTPQIVNNVVLYNCLFDTPNDDGALLPQMSAQVFFVVEGADDVPLVPMAALRRAKEPGKYTAQVVGEDDPRIVTIGASNRLVAEVKTGLSVGDEVLLNNIPVQGGSRGEVRRLTPQGNRPRM
ncbi:MAG: efflux RND transporter periplasmic adaptor subunit [Alphaproteobacteria bacterium]|nr:efflux RND transporter periplasmic adaptor subunit [Alphaproteobacteria bacterium]